MLLLVSVNECFRSLRLLLFFTGYKDQQKNNQQTNTRHFNTTKTITTTSNRPNAPTRQSENLDDRFPVEQLFTSDEIKKKIAQVVRELRT